MPPPLRRSHLPQLLGGMLLAIAALLSCAQSASAHGFSTIVYADMSSGDSGHVTMQLQLEYDLLAVSAADAQKNDSLYRTATDAFNSGDSSQQAVALQSHIGTVLAYVSDRLTVEAAGQRCNPQPSGDVTMTVQQGVPYAVLVLDYACPATGEGHTVSTKMFADNEGYITGAQTFLTYSLDVQQGSAVLDAQSPSFSTHQTLAERLLQFFRLGAEHLLTGIDHILFLIALIVGSRRLREVVFAATSFTLAHSVTFICAATRLVVVPDIIVEPVIALSISIVAAWYLWIILRRRGQPTVLEIGQGPLGLDRAGWVRCGVVFCFGLIHGLGFAGALGINEPWSWKLLGSLLVFNLGIETVQLGIILVCFPLLALLRRRATPAAIWVTGAIAAGVTIVGLYWFVERVASGISQ